MTQKERVFEFIKALDDKATSNQLRSFGVRSYIGHPERRARELIAEGRLCRRWITGDEMQLEGLKTKVMVYYVPTNGNGQKELF